MKMTFTAPTIAFIRAIRWVAVVPVAGGVVAGTLWSTTLAAHASGDRTVARAENGAIELQSASGGSGLSASGDAPSGRGGPPPNGGPPPFGSPPGFGGPPPFGGPPFGRRGWGGMGSEVLLVQVPV